jgi:hypothetical protein
VHDLVGAGGDVGDQRADALAEGGVGQARDLQARVPARRLVGEGQERLQRLGDDGDVAADEGVGVLISWAMPADSSPMEASFSRWASCSPIRRSSSVRSAP